ncbi:hypothetical protein XBKB1_610004 [Xenorhabdus bovienii str. kraussei Becker Underwood]|uniref:Uncharacterized protein n=1 Tax=Xenorhabdus bovienii str. kraussei Becker Underwood TaxID=1398204 RepID=A0A077PPX5_XENBV|nr:hypothetical protein XBKB1_610004 [Xenorhabdus bovienii str. kraussei Becker Underwood]
MVLLSLMSDKIIGMKIFPLNIVSKELHGQYTTLKFACSPFIDIVMDYKICKS